MWKTLQLKHSLGNDNNASFIPQASQRARGICRLRINVETCRRTSNTNHHDFNPTARNGPFSNQKLLKIEWYRNTDQWPHRPLFGPTSAIFSLITFWENTEDIYDHPQSSLLSVDDVASIVTDTTILLFMRFSAHSVIVHWLRESRS